MAQRNIEWFSVHTNGVALRQIALQNIRRSSWTLNCLALHEIFRCYGKSSSLLVAGRDWCAKNSVCNTGDPRSSCEMIILHNNSHGGIIRVCMRIFTTVLRNKAIRQILNKNTSPYFHSVSLVIWPFTLMKRTHFSELSISRFSTYIRKELFLCTLKTSKWTTR